MSIFDLGFRLTSFQASLAYDTIQVSMKSFVSRVAKIIFSQPFRAHSLASGEMYGYGIELKF